MVSSRLPDLWFVLRRTSAKSGEAPDGVPIGGTQMGTPSYGRATAERSQFWSQLSKFVNVCERPIDRFASVNGDLTDHPEPRFADLESRLGFRPHESSVVSSAAGTASSSRPHQGPRPTVGWQARFASAVTRLLRRFVGRSDRQRPFHYLGMVPIDSSLSGEFSTGSVVETETAEGLTE